MQNKTIIVTGANAGMGLATTIALAKKGIHVIMACRDTKRGNEAKERAIEESNSTNISLYQCDLGSMESIYNFADQIKEDFDKIDGLINNAGVVSLKHTKTKDGFESMIGVNHLGHFLLTNLLLDMLKKSNQARIINVASGAYKAGTLDYNDMHFNNRSFNVIKGYGQSKLCNILFTLELNKHLEGTNISTFVLHPGAVSTSLGVDRQTGFGEKVHRLLRPFFLTSEEGAETAIYLATEPKIDHLSGRYFYKKKLLPTKYNKVNEDEAKKLWNWSLKELGLNQKAIEEVTL